MALQLPIGHDQQLLTSVIDPLSITTSCLALIGVVAKTSIAITAFIRDCREARGDLISVNRELSELKIVLELLQEDTAGHDGELLLSESLQTQILSIIHNCGDVSARVEQVLTDLRGSRIGAIKWVLDRKKEVASLKQSLEAHRSALSLALEMVNMRVDSIQACSVKEDTGVIREEVGEIKQDTAQILDEIERLKERLPLSDRDYVIQAYLDSLTTYAATVYDALDDDRVASDNGDVIEDGLDHTANPVSPKVKPSVQLGVTPATQKKDTAPLDSTISDGELRALEAFAQSAQDKSLQERVRALKESRQRQKETQVLVDSVSHISGIATEKLPAEVDEETKGNAKSSNHQPKIEDLSVSKRAVYEVDENSEGDGHDYDEHYDYGDGSDYDPYSYADSENENWNRAAMYQNELPTGQGSKDRPSKRSCVPIIDLNVAVAEGPSHGTNHHKAISAKQQTSTATGLPRKQQSTSPLQAMVNLEQTRALPLFSQGHTSSIKYSETVVSGSQSSQLLWPSLRDSCSISTIKSGELKNITKGTNNVIAMGLSQDGVFGVFLQKDRTVSVWDMNDNSRVGREFKRGRFGLAKPDMAQIIKNTKDVFNQTHLKGGLESMHLDSFWFELPKIAAFAVDERGTDIVYLCEEGHCQIAKMTFGFVFGSGSDCVQLDDVSPRCVLVHYDFDRDMVLGMVFSHEYDRVVTAWTSKRHRSNLRTIFVNVWHQPSKSLINHTYALSNDRMDLVYQLQLSEGLESIYRGLRGRRWGLPSQLFDNSFFWKKSDVNGSFYSGVYYWQAGTLKEADILGTVLRVQA
ncbi:hypothetical protein G7054_g4232 [Neopestalotiopsis clavispora]|nr:hypothetical protein G7054_g4232 [Neopestalotiopsis clavispora]